VEKTETSRHDETDRASSSTGCRHTGWRVEAGLWILIQIWMQLSAMFTYVGGKSGVTDFLFNLIYLFGTNKALPHGVTDFNTVHDRDWKV
jgi:hypothetical protein